MPRTRVEVQVNAPIERVFDVFSDLPATERRIPAILRIEVLNPGPMRVGTRWRETRQMFGQEATETMEVAAFDPPRSYAVTAQSNGCAYRSTYTFTPEDTGTRVALEFVGTAETWLAWLFSPLAWVMAGMVRKMLYADMTALKQVCEHGDRP